MRLEVFCTPERHIKDMPRAKPHQRPPDLPHTLLSAIGQQWSRPCRPAESGLASRGMGCLVFCPAKPSSNRFRLARSIRLNRSTDQ